MEEKVIDWSVIHAAISEFEDQSVVIRVLLILFIFGMLGKLFDYTVMALLRRMANRSKDQVYINLMKKAHRPILFLFIVLGVFFALHTLHISGEMYVIYMHGVKALGTFALFWLIFSILDPLVKIIDKANLFSHDHKMMADDVHHFVVMVLEIMTTVLGIVSILQELGFNVSTFLGGIGLVGAAFALAAKDSLANLVGGILIILDRSFKKGDWIQTPSVEGVVEKVGVRTTRIRTFALSQVTIPNSQLTSNDPITNWSNMFHRRVRLKIHLTFHTTADQLEEITSKIKTYLEEDKDVVPPSQAELLVDLVDYTESSILLDLYYFTRTTNWTEWRGIRHRHIIAFKRIVEEAGSEFAFPSRSVYIESDHAEDIMDSKA